MRFRIFHNEARSILSETSGFIAQAGFTHSVTPARNCTYACTYCYVPTMRVHGGLRAEDWQRWGQFTTFKSNAPELLRNALRGHEAIYCSPLVDPYQPAEITECLMRRILQVLIERPPSVFTIQTRGPLILRDLDLLHELRDRTRLRVSFSITTNRDDIRGLYDPHCEPNSERLEAIRELTSAGIETFATLAPLLPCDPEELANAAMAITPCDLIGDPLHVRAVKKSGATTREAAARIAELHGHEAWFDPEFQFTIVERLQRIAAQQGRRFAAGPEGFSWLSQT